MTKWIKLSLLFFCVGVFGGRSDITTNLFIPTQFYNPADGRSDALRLEWQKIPLGQTGEVLQRASSVMDLSVPSLNATAYFSPETAMQDRIELFMQIQAQLSQAFPGKQIPLKIRVLEEDGSAVTPEEKDTPTELRNSLSPLQQPKRMRDVVENVSVFKAFMGASQRAVQLYLSGVVPTPEAFAAGLGLGTTEAVLSYYGTKYENELGKNFSEHHLPLPKNPLSIKINEVYANHSAARLIKGTLANIGLWGIVTPALSQTLAHISNPQVSHAVSPVDIGRWVGLGALGNLIYFGGFRGLENLRQKGWLTQPSMDTMLKGTGLLYNLSSVLNTTGRPELLAYLPFVIGPMWALYGSPALISPLLSPKTDRIIFTDPNLKNRADLNQLEALESTLLMPQPLNEQNEAFDKVRTLEPIKRRLHNRIAETAINTGSTGITALVQGCNRIFPKSNQ